jgi:hypothetical protein
MSAGISDFGFRISDFPATQIMDMLRVGGGKSEIRNPQSEIFDRAAGPRRSL